MFGHSGRGAAGFIQVYEPGADAVEQETRRCCHCGSHWTYQPGSGTTRGFCMSCSGLTCGSEACNSCLPYEAMIELAEGAKPGSPSRKYLEVYDKIMRGA